jgi:hypothetical protein
LRGIDGKRRQLVFKADGYVFLAREKDKGSEFSAISSAEDRPIRTNPERAAAGAKAPL